MPRRKKQMQVNFAEIANLYYTAQEAQARLGMKRDTFNNYVRRGAISRHVILGTHGYYKRAEIDAIAEKIEFALLVADIPDLSYHFATFDDLSEINRLALLNFGERAISPERVAARRHYLELNPESTVVLYNHSILVASLDFVPLKHSALLAFREGKRGWQFPDDVEQFAPGQRLECIIIDFMATTNAPPSQRERYSSYLLRRFGRETLVEWAKRGVDIKSIDACGGTELGKRILQSAGFINLGVRNGRDIYTLDLDTSDLKPLEAYKSALAEWKQSQER